MAKLKKLDDQKLRQARRQGLRRKPPKKPKGKATLSQLENYIKRRNDWITEVETKAKEFIQREKLIEEIRKAG